MVLVRPIRPEDEPLMVAFHGTLSERSVYMRYLEIMKQEDWPNPSISSAGARTTTVGPSGVKMTGPYEYVAPSFWYVDTRHGGAFGFNTETSPGPAPPLASCLRKFIPADHMWPQDSFWNFHAGSEGFKDLSHFNSAMDAIYGAPSAKTDKAIVWLLGDSASASADDDDAALKPVIARGTGARGARIELSREQGRDRAKLTIFRDTPP